MRKYLGFLLFFSAYCAAATTAPAEQTVLGKEVVSNLSTNGNVMLDGTTITDSLKVIGSLKAQHATIGQLEVVGHTALKEVVIKGDATLEGSVKIAHSEFEGALKITSPQIFLADSVLNSLVVGKSETGSETIYMSNTVIKGPVTFESGNGKILKKSGSKIIGEIKGAKFNL